MTRSSLFLAAAVILVANCTPRKTVPHEEHYGIYALNRVTSDVTLIYSCAEPITVLSPNPSGTRFAFARTYGSDMTSDEVGTIAADGSDFRRLTNNAIPELYPCWSPDGTQLAFLSMPDSTLDIWVMDSSGGNAYMLYDSGRHDADIDWAGDLIAFTSASCIWTMHADGTQPVKITNPPRAGEWGNASLPFGDYDPRFSPDGSKIVFERLVDDSSPHGNYDLFSVNPGGTGETRLTNTGYSQGMARWSHTGDELAYVVAAIGTTGSYDIWQMNRDGSDNRNVTPDYFPGEFLCYDPIFSPGDSLLYFVGEW